MRWAAVQLRKEGIMKPTEDSPDGIWELKKYGLVLLFKMLEG
jgi:hypothetical protein